MGHILIRQMQVLLSSVFLSDGSTPRVHKMEDEDQEWHASSNLQCTRFNPTQLNGVAKELICMTHGHELRGRGRIAGGNGGTRWRR